MTRPRLLDLFSGAGGAARGYQRAGFYVVGVDHKDQPRYAGDEFHQADALEYCAEHGREFDAIHASPPCQLYSSGRFCRGESKKPLPDLAGATSRLLKEVGKPYVIENVPRAPIENGLMLCGMMFGLTVFRHRKFELSFFILNPFHIQHGKERLGKNGFVGVYGSGESWKNGLIPKDHRRKAAWENAMRIDWMLKYELREAVPPAYTEWIGERLMEALP